MLGNNLIVFGLILVGVALAGFAYLYFAQPETLRQMTKRWRGSPGVFGRLADHLAANAVARSQSDQRPAQRLADKVATEPAVKIAASDDVPMNVRLQNAAVGTVIKLQTVDGPVSGEIETVITHRELTQVKGEWGESGDSFCFLILSSGHWLLVRDERIELFEKPVQLNDATMARYLAVGKAWLDGARDGKLVTSPNGLTAFDVGRSNISSVGVEHYASLVRFIEFQADDRVEWFEERKAGKDVIMIGTRLQLTDVMEVL